MINWFLMVHKQKKDIWVCSKIPVKNKTMAKKIPNTINKIPIKQILNIIKWNWKKIIKIKRNKKIVMINEIAPPLDLIWYHLIKLLNIYYYFINK